VACSRSRRASARRLRAPASYREEADICIVHHAFADGANLTNHGKFVVERWMMEMVSAPGLPKHHRFGEIITEMAEGVCYVEEPIGRWRTLADDRGLSLSVRDVNQQR